MFYPVIPFAIINEVRHPLCDAILWLILAVDFTSHPELNQAQDRVKRGDAYVLLKIRMKIYFEMTDVSPLASSSEHAASTVVPVSRMLKILALKQQMFRLIQ